MSAARLFATLWLAALLLQAAPAEATRARRKRRSERGGRRRRKRLPRSYRETTSADPGADGGAVAPDAGGDLDRRRGPLPAGPASNAGDEVRGEETFDEAALAEPASPFAPPEDRLGVRN